ncbi:hypothetical protein [Tamilnaduibacter salinus]|nr:hypothetical protein [Tamilnaduibacter salinus]
MAPTGVAPGRAGMNIHRGLLYAVTLTAIGLLVGLLLEALDRQVNRAEAASARLVVNQLRAALIVKGAELRLSSHPEHMLQWRGKNPVSLLQKPPRAYQGRCGDSGPAAAKWCFSESGEVRYRTRSRIALAGQERPPETIVAWRVAMDYRDRNGNGTPDKQDRLDGLKLAPVRQKTGGT